MTDVVTSYRRGGRECICVPDPEDINGGMRDDCLIHGDFDSGEVEHILRLHRRRSQPHGGLLLPYVRIHLRRPTFRLTEGNTMRQRLIETYRDDGGKFRWRLVAANGHDILADSGKGYVERNKARKIAVDLFPDARVVAL